jgi:hypothetical protein
LRRWRRLVQSCQERHAPSVESSVMGLVPSNWFNRLSRRPLHIAGASAQPPTLQLSAWQALDDAAKHYIDHNRWGHTRRPVPKNVSSLSNIQLTWSRELDVATKVGLLAHRQSTAVALTGIGASRPSGPSSQIRWPISLVMNAIRPLFASPFQRHPPSVYGPVTDHDDQEPSSLSKKRRKSWESDVKAHV